MKIVLKCLHFNIVLLSLASIIFRILSVAFDLLTVCILNRGTCLQENQDLQCNFYQKRLLFQDFSVSSIV